MSVCKWCQIKSNESVRGVFSLSDSARFRNSQRSKHHAIFSHLCRIELRKLYILKMIIPMTKKNLKI